MEKSIAKARESLLSIPIKRKPPKKNKPVESIKPIEPIKKNPTIKFEAKDDFYLCIHDTTNGWCVLKGIEFLIIEPDRSNCKICPDYKEGLVKI
jgi:hypothetical protein